MGPSRLPRDLLRAQNRRKRMPECFAHAQLSATAIPCTLRIQKPSKKSSLYGARCSPWVHTGYIHHAKPKYVQFTPKRPCTGPARLGAFYGHTILGSPCRKILHAQHSATTIPRPYGSKGLQTIVRACTANRVITHGVPRYWPLRDPQTVWELHVT